MFGVLVADILGIGVGSYGGLLIGYLHPFLYLVGYGIREET